MEHHECARPVNMWRVRTMYPDIGRIVQHCVFCDYFAIRSQTNERSVKLSNLIYFCWNFHQIPHLFLDALDNSWMKFIPTWLLARRRLLIRMSEMPENSCTRDADKSIITILANNLYASLTYLALSRGCTSSSSETRRWHWNSRSIGAN